MAALKSFLVAEKAAGKRIFPKGGEWFGALDLTPLDKVRVVILGPGSLSRPRPGARPLLLGPARRPAAAEPGQHLQGAGDRPRHPPGPARLPRTLGEAGRAAAEQRAHRRDGPRRLAPRARLGAVHRRRHPPRRRAARSGRVHALGQLRAEEGRVRAERRAGRPSSRAQGAAPLAALRPCRLLRLPPFLQGERLPRLARPAADRLGAARQRPEGTGRVHWTFKERARYPRADRSRHHPKDFPMLPSSRPHSRRRPGDARRARRAGAERARPGAGASARGEHDDRRLHPDRPARTLAWAAR